jgi:hypothetical protein
MLVDEASEDGPCLIEIAAGEQQHLDALTARAPFFYLVEIILVREQRIVGFLAAPIVGHVLRSALSRDDKNSRGSGWRRGHRFQKAAVQPSESCAYLFN